MMLQTFRRQCPTAARNFLCASRIRGISTVTPSDAQRSTIFALSTPPGKAGVAVIRVSGPDALHVWKRLIRNARRRGDLGNGLYFQPEQRKMEKCKIVHPESGEVLDDGLAVFFKGPKSFTTEDVVELHLHSGRAIISAVLSALATIKSCRPAEPGEFTRRAFLGGRMDLTQVEGLRDLLEAQTDTQRKLALRAAAGDMRARFEELRTQIIHCLAMVEALIDFGEGEEIEEGVYEQAQTEARNLLQTIRGHLNDSRRGEILRTGIRLAIFGPPNAGKSSLLNFLARREAAIVTPIPGTTRDVIELSLDIGGLPIIVADTAGLRKTKDLVESIGIERTKEAVQAADVSICVLSLPEMLNSAVSPSKSLEASALQSVPQIPPSVASLIAPNTYFLLNKADLLDSTSSLGVARQSLERAMGEEANGEKMEATARWENVWAVSLQNGKGTEEFMESFAKSLKQSYDISADGSVLNDSYMPLITHTRQRVHLESAARFIEAFLSTPPEDVVLGAEELRYAAQAVGRISGLIDVEDVLDVVFKDFCIGK
ncbi:mitochondrial splicing system protein [Pleurotus pulmonarius]|nr:mitochondrial splicing system protein [Pleurotus pulmonarius]